MTLKKHWWNFKLKNATPPTITSGSAKMRVTEKCCIQSRLVATCPEIFWEYHFQQKISGQEPKRT